MNPFTRLEIATISLFVIVGLIGQAVIAQQPATKSESFDHDPKWDCLNNRTAKPKVIEQVFGAAADGRVGGMITGAAEPAYFAKTIQSKSMNDSLNASGTLLCPDGRANALIGFFNSASLNEWRTPNTIVIRINGRGNAFQAYVEYDTMRWRAGSSQFELPPDSEKTGKGAIREFAIHDVVHSWSLKYDPAGNDGGGTITAKIDDQVSVCNLVAGHKLDGAKFNRFGLLNIMKHADDKGEIWLGDLTIDAEKQKLSANSGWEGFQNHRKYATLDVRPNAEYGFSPTHFAGGKRSGELGGLTFRGDIRLPNGVNYYADRLDTLTLEKPLKASGKIASPRSVTDSATLIGFFQVPTSVTVDPASPKSPKGWTDYLPKNFFGVAIKGPAREGFFFHPTYRLDGDQGGGNPGSPIPNCPRLNPDGLSHDWSFEYSPTGASGNGQITVMIDKQSATLDLAPGHKSAGARFNRFGIVSNWIDGNGQMIYLDDLTFTAHQE